MQLKSQNLKKKILIAQLNSKRSLNNERLLERAVSEYFKGLQKEVLDKLEEYWNEYQLLQGHVDLIIAPVNESHEKYYNILAKHDKREYKLGQDEAQRLINIVNEQTAQKGIRNILQGKIKRKTNLFGTIKWSEDDLLNKVFIASKRTLERVTNQLNQIITDGYKSGKGINIVANMLTTRFNQLSTWEARRIARTEIHNSHNQGVMNIYNEIGVEYTQWIAASDDRTRDSHVEVDGEIIPIGGKYSNGLSYPGDMSGPLEEWINCRCSNAPFVIPYGYLAPSFSPFREEDLIPIETQNPLDNIEQQTVEPTIDAPYQLNNRENSFSDVKITQEQFEKVIAHQSKREKAKLEFGNSIDNETGNLIHAKDIRGKKNRVHVPTSNRPYSVIHNHTNDGGFSGGDAYSHILGAKQQVCYATTPKGVWIMRDTSQGTFSKKEGFISEHTATEIKYKMEGKYREIVKDVKSKYQSKYDNAKTREEKNKIGQKVNNEVFTQYNDWLLDEFAVGKRRDWLIEIEFIPKEKLKDVKF